MTEKTLEDRFYDFLSQLSGSENIDTMITEDILSHKKRADFLLGNRKIVLEIKTLKSDPEGKIQKQIKELEKRDDYPMMYWSTPVHNILDHLPDGEAIKKKMFHSMTRSIQGAFESANQQIIQTKESLAIPDAGGVLAILNEDIRILDPAAMCFCINNMFMKKKDGRVRYPHVSFVWIIGEGHSMALPQGSEATPLIIIEGPTGEQYPIADKLLDGYLREWAEFGGMPLMHMKGLKDFNDLPFKNREVTDTGKENQTGMTRSDYWRMEYKQSPYMRTFTKEQFLEHTGNILSSMMPHFLKGGIKMPHHVVAEYMRGWSHALEEAEYRNLDMKELYDYLPDFNSDKQNHDS